MKKELDLLISEAMSVHGGWIFREYYEMGRNSKESFCQFTKEQFENLVTIEDIEKEMIQKFKRVVNGEITPLNGWLEYFEWYPSHGEYAGLVVGYLVRDGRYNDALRVLKKCVEVLGRLDWDT